MRDDGGEWDVWVQKIVEEPMSDICHSERFAMDVARYQSMKAGVYGAYCIRRKDGKKHAYRRGVAKV